MPLFYQSVRRMLEEEIDWLQRIEKSITELEIGCTVDTSRPLAVARILTNKGIKWCNCKWTVASKGSNNPAGSLNQRLKLARSELSYACEAPLMRCA